MPYKPYQKTGNNSSAAANNANNMANEDVDMMVQGGNGTGPVATPASKKQFPQKFAGIAKAKPVPNSIKKKRTNYRLRKILIPKAPLMVLNEMVGSVNYNFIENPPMQMQPGMPHLFTAQCTVDNEVHTGTGPSKQIAKNICAEHAIQSIVSKRCSDPKNRAQIDDEGNPLKHHQLEDETPWAQLASLALFKLFNDWQAQGYQLPPELLRPPAENDSNPAMDQSSNDMGDIGDMGQFQHDKMKTGGVAKKIPENPTERHPVQLLNEVQGGVCYNLLEETGSPPNLVFTMGTEINGVVYKGEGKNKKDAKRNCALQALQQIYNITYNNTAA